MNQSPSLSSRSSIFVTMESLRNPPLFRQNAPFYVNFYIFL